MTIFDVIKADHKKIKALLGKLDKTTEEQSSLRRSLFAQFKKVLVNHAGSEEKAVYVPLKTREKTRDMSFEGYEEHHLVDHLVKVLTKLSPSKETWTAKMTVVKELLEHHIEEEESDMFKKMRSGFNSDELDEMAVNMKQAKAGKPVTFKKQPSFIEKVESRFLTN